MAALAKLGHAISALQQVWGRSGGTSAAHVAIECNAASRTWRCYN